MERTHTCGALNQTHIDQSVTLMGWVHKRRDLGGLIFIDLRDRYGITQVVFQETEQASKLRHEWVIAITGKVVKREQPNQKIPTGEIEIVAQDLTIFSKAKTPPFSICEDEEFNEELRLKYRYLDIRRGDIAEKLAVRSKTMLDVRNFLSQNAFLEITTPIMAKSTPEGARDYLVPSRIHPGHFYALPQSPQIFKQLLMLSGMDRYFQIAQCFRDEDLRADRQPEFTQIDIEMSFSTPETLLSLVEDLMLKLFSQAKGPFRRMSYAECIESYGTDRPDLRFGMAFKRFDSIAERSDFAVFKQALEKGHVIKAISLPGGEEMSRREIDKLTEFVQKFGLGGLGWMKRTADGYASNIVKFFSEDLLGEVDELLDVKPGDLVLIGAGPEIRVNQALDHLRRKLAHERNLIPQDCLEFVWVTDFPLFEYDEEEARYKSLHHPFTAPHPDDLDLLEENPLKVRSIAYDLVLNGNELGGGSQRIHDSNIQERIFRTLSLTQEEIDEKFGFFVEALSYGTPPHLGIAFGLDRIIMLMTNTDNIRDVIAFPKTARASDLMLDCPATVHPSQLEELHIEHRSL